MNETKCMCVVPSWIHVILLTTSLPVHVETFQALQTWYAIPNRLCNFTFMVKLIRDVLSNSLLLIIRGEYGGPKNRNDRPKSNELMLGGRKIVWAVRFQVL